jgi:hypothetical protein
VTKVVTRKGVMGMSMKENIHMINRRKIMTPIMTPEEEDIEEGINI